MQATFFFQSRQKFLLLLVTGKVNQWPSQLGWGEDFFFFFSFSLCVFYKSSSWSRWSGGIATIWRFCILANSVVVQLFSRVQLLVTLWTAARQASPSFTSSSLLVLIPLSQWCHPTISSAAAPFSSCPQSFPASGSFPMSWLLASGGQRIGAYCKLIPLHSGNQIIYNNFKYGMSQQLHLYRWACCLLPFS